MSWLLKKHPSNKAISVNCHPSDGLISVLSVNYHPSGGAISVPRVNSHPFDGVISVLNVNYLLSNGVISVLSVDYLPSGRVISIKSQLCIHFAEINFPPVFKSFCLLNIVLFLYKIVLQVGVMLINHVTTILHSHWWEFLWRNTD